MQQEEIIARIISEFSQGIKLAKCRKCGCMHDALQSLRSAPIPPDVLNKVELWLSRIESIEYHCLGCEYCYPAVILNLFYQAFPNHGAAFSLCCSGEVREEGWPPIPGEYVTFPEEITSPVAVSTLASPELAEGLSRVRPQGLCIVGKTETENIGIDKIIKNTISNPTIKFLLLAGPDSQGHCSGSTLLALSENGVDDQMRVIGSPGRRPVLANATSQEIEAFRRQVKIIDMIGCEDQDSIVNKIIELSRINPEVCICKECAVEKPAIKVPPIAVIKAEKAGDKKLDAAGYFVIIPQSEKNKIIVDHYSYNNRLLRVLEGNDADSICYTIIKGGWVTELTHAAYLGRELIRAQLSMEMGFTYVQDGA
jgi:tetrahydromethanopterin S-methyltransferase subunit A